MAEKAENKQGHGGAGAAATLVFKADLHCEGCAQKVKRNLKQLTGVESVKVDLVTNKVTVVGNVDPTVVKQRVESKIKKSVELVSPQPAKTDKAAPEGGGDGKKSEKKAEELKGEKPKEAQVTTIVLKTDVHCDGCAKKMNKIVNKYEGVQSVNVELVKDQITITGTMDMKEMLPYLIAKFKRPVEVFSPPAKKGDGGEGKTKDGGKPAAAGGGEGGSKIGPAEEIVGNVENVYKMEYGYPYYGYGIGNHFYNPQQGPAPEYGYVAEYGHAPPYLPAPEMFSDENPNACSVM